MKVHRNKQTEYQLKKELPFKLTLFWSQIRHCGFRTILPGTCSTSLQNISGPISPQVALVEISDLLAKFKIAGNKPKKKKKKESKDHKISRNYKIIYKHFFFICESI